MPIYEFMCENCGDTFDVHASIQEKENGIKPACPKCNYEITRQVLSAGMFIRTGGTTNFNPPGCAPNAGPGCCG